LSGLPELIERNELHFGLPAGVETLRDGRWAKRRANKRGVGAILASQRGRNATAEAQATQRSDRSTFEVERGQHGELFE